MKKCLVCGSNYASQLTCCPVCGTKTVKINGFASYAPSLVQQESGFKVAAFSHLVSLEDKNFWFCVRNRLIIWALRKYCPTFQSFMEIGCGTGFVLSGINDAFPQTKIYGSEIFPAGLAFAAERVPKSNLMQMDARQIPFVDEFDAIGAFDVLEHIQEDKQVLFQMHQALKSSGILVITVPQHSWLWSSVDDRACHVRRYSAEELHNKVETSGFQILRSTSFVSILLPALWISRLAKRNSQLEREATAELKISPLLNRILKAILAIELPMIRAGINFPLGGSRLLVAKKL